MNKKRTYKRIVLPPANGITGKSSNPYKEYRTLRKHSADFDRWVRRTYGKQGARCFYCACDLSKRRINVEHVVPLSKDGQTSSSNMVISCAPCNKAKGSTLVPTDQIKKYEKKAHKRRRREAIKYKSEIEYQEDLASSLSWIV